ncbi:hypothetical protein, partial [Streptomyces sp. NPDC048282]|uniref:hypothetical protein n=1 Tax=Streptomyces sp. NPDC048282 TaxID=3365528 RepID=UPI00371CCF66
MRKRAGIVVGLFAVSTFVVGVPTAEAKVCAYNSCSYAINSWKAAKICDGDKDGNYVESNYYRDSGSHGTVNPLGLWRSSKRPAPRRSWLGGRVRSRSDSG